MQNYPVFPVSHHRFTTYQLLLSSPTLLYPSSNRLTHGLPQAVSYMTIIMLLQLILALTALAVNAFVMPRNNSTRSIQSLRKRTPLPPHDCDLHIPNPDHDQNDADTFTSLQMEQFIRGHTDVLKICLMIIEEAEKAARPGEKNHFNRVYARCFALVDREFVVGQSPTFLLTRLVIRRLTFRRCLQGDLRLQQREERQPEIRPHQTVRRLHRG
jgi:hypothetical protein